MTYSDSGTNKTVTSAATTAVANIDDTGSIANITGTAAEDTKLTAGAITDLDGVTGTIVYSWKADGMVINLATSSTYTLTQAEVGKIITVDATYTDAISNTRKTVTSAATAAVTNVNDTGSIAAISSSVIAVGETLTAGEITDEDGVPTSGSGVPTYQWQVSDTANGTYTGITGATNSTFILTTDQIGKFIKVTATYTDSHAGSSAEMVTSAATTVVLDDVVPPTVSNVVITGKDGSGDKTNLKQGDTVVVTLTMSEPVNVVTTNGTPSYEITIGSTTKSATYVSSGTNTLVFEYTIEASLTDTSGISAGTNKLTLNGGTIKDVSNAENPITDTSTLAVTSSIKVDTTNPNFTSGTIAAIAENAPTTTAVYTSAVTDTSSITYSLINGTATTPSGVITDKAKFAISTTGVVTLANPADFEADAAYAIGIVATDTAGNSTTQQVAVSVTNVDEAGSVAITGTKTQGQELTATITDPDGTLSDQTYVWKANGTTISGVTSNQHTLTQAEVGKTITVETTYIDAQGANKSKTSAATATIANIQDAGTITDITGTPTVGQILTAGSVTDIDGTATGLTYQWQSATTANGTYTNIAANAASETYTLVSGDTDKFIRVIVTYKDGYNNDGTVGTTDAQTVTSASTAAIVAPTLSYETTTAFTEASANDGSVVGKITVTLTNDTFTAATGTMTKDTDYSVSNVPVGLTMVVTRTSTTTTEIIFTGTANAHTNAQDIANIGITFKAAAFTNTSNIDAVANNAKTDIGIDFDNPAAPILSTTTPQPLRLQMAVTA